GVIGDNLLDEELLGGVAEEAPPPLGEPVTRLQRPVDAGNGLAAFVGRGQRCRFRGSMMTSQTRGSGAESSALKRQTPMRILHRSVPTHRRDTAVTSSRCGQPPGRLRGLEP